MAFNLMKRVLSLLVLFVFLQTQAWALSGGPFQNNVGGGNVIGTYAGVIVPDPAKIGTNVNGDPRATAIGLFSFAQPEVGFAVGPLLAFVDGTPLLGTITGLIDPEDGKLNAVINALSTYDVIFVLGVDANGTLQTLEVPLSGNGNMEAEIVFARSLFGTFGGLNSARVTGTAGIDLFLFVRNDGTPRVTQTVNFEVEGFKQSDEATTVSLTFESDRNG